MQPWPGEVLEQRAGEIAAGFASLLTRHAAWLHRRVETMTVLSHEQVRRSVSVDFTVPLEHRDDLQLADGQWIVPLALLAKGELVHFDLRAEDLSSVPLLRSEETQVIARELLYLLADLDLDEGDEVPDIGALIERVLTAAPEEADAAAEAAAAWRNRLPSFAALAERLSSHFLLCAVLGDVARRRVVKFAYDELFGRPERAVHHYDVPGCAEGASYHAEVDVPDELRARATTLIDTRTGRVLAAGPRNADRPAVHFVAEPGVDIQPTLRVQYGTERGRFLLPAALVAWVIALELLVPLVFADLDRLAASGGPAIALLLSSSAVFSALVLRSGEHPLVRVMLAPYRLCLAAATLAAVLAGGVLAFQAASAALTAGWAAGAAVAALAAVILTSEAARAPGATKP
ncbi:MAG TPA: hypothetical protein VFG79_22405 [Solirubrobacter sp.]|nr:hypothetical protein [Solirubrobacter sp.]